MRWVAAALCALSPAAVDPPAPADVEAFPAYLWRLEHRDRPLPDALLAAAGGSHVERDGDAAWLVAAGAPFYVGHGPGRDDLHLERDALGVARVRAEFAATRDAAALVRTPCLSDPATRARLATTLAASLAPPDRARADFVSLGDEVSVTPWGDPLDLCRGPHCDAAFEAWLAAGEGARYGLGPGATRPPTDALLAAPDARRLGAWLAARAFQRAVLTDALTALAAAAREARPGLPVGLLGLVGETAYGGVDLEGVAGHVDVLEPYPVADAVERCASLRALGAGPRTVLATLFLGEHDAASLAARLAAFVDSPVDGVVVWCDRDLAERPGLASALAGGLEALRADRAAHPDRDRDPHGVALLHSDDSLAHAFLRDARADRTSWTARLAGHQERHGHHERRRRELLAELRAAGQRPGAVAVERIDAGVTARFPRLVALDLTVVSDDELARLDAHVAAGGELTVRGPFAALRPDGTRRPRADVPARLR